MIRGVWIIGVALVLAPAARAEDSVCRLKKSVPKLDIRRTTRLPSSQSLVLDNHVPFKSPTPCGSENFVELQSKYVGGKREQAVLVVRDASAESLRVLPVGEGDYTLMRDPDRIFVSRSDAESLILDCKGKQLAAFPASRYGGRAGTSTVTFNHHSVYVLPQGAKTPVRFQTGEREQVDRVETFDRNHAVVTTFSVVKKGAALSWDQNVYLFDSAGKVVVQFKTDGAVASSSWRDWNVEGITRLPGNSGFFVRTNGARSRPGAAWDLGQSQPGVYLFSSEGQLRKFVPTEGLPDQSRLLPDGKIAVEVHRGFTDRRSDRNYMLIVDPSTGQSQELAEFEHPVDFGLSGNGNTVSIDRRKQELLQMTDRGERLPATSIARAPDAASTTRGVWMEDLASGPGGTTLVLIRETDYLHRPPQSELQAKVSGSSLSGTRSRAILLPARGGPLAAESVFDVGPKAELLPVGNDLTVVHGPDGLVLLDPGLGVRARFKPDRGGKIFSVKSVDEKRLGVTYQGDGVTYLGFFDKETLALVGRVQVSRKGYGGVPTFSEKRDDGTVHVMAAGNVAIVQTGSSSESFVRTTIMGPCAQVGKALAPVESVATPAGERR